MMITYDDNYDDNMMHVVYDELMRFPHKKHFRISSVPYSYVTLDKLTLLNKHGLQNAVLIGGIPPTKNRIWRCKYRKYASRLLSFVAHIVSRVPQRIVTKFQRLYTCIRGRAV